MKNLATNMIKIVIYFPFEVTVCQEKALWMWSGSLICNEQSESHHPRKQSRAEKERALWRLLQGEQSLDQAFNALRSSSIASTRSRVLPLRIASHKARSS